ncbi:MAG: sugar phosphate isomerase/epimerase [Bryobacteraceae bacterium]
MHRIGRRKFISLAAASAGSLHARTLQTVGVQLYTVRGILPKKPLATLKAIEAIGYREVEVTADGLDAIWPSLRQTSLRPVSAHLDPELFVRQQSKLPAAIEDMKKRSIEYVVCPWIDPRDRGGAEMIRKLGDTLNKAGEICRREGMRLCYHNHAFEYRPVGEGRLLDILMKSTDPKLVNLELDVMWAHVAGVDPVSILKQYGDRIPLVHLKNVAPGVKPRFDENIPGSAFRDLGNGEVDIPAVLRAAAGAGVKHYFVEQDETPGDPLQALRASFDYLQKINY